jgi:hypothetical protein
LLSALPLLLLELDRCWALALPPADTGLVAPDAVLGTLDPIWPDGELDGLGSALVVLIDFSLVELIIGTNGGISFGGKVLKPGLESRPDSLLPWELGRLLDSESEFFSDLSLSFFSSGGIIGLDGDVSFPMALQV